MDKLARLKAETLHLYFIKLQCKEKMEVKIDFCTKVDKNRFHVYNIKLESKIGPSFCLK